MRSITYFFSFIFFLSSWMLNAQTLKEEIDGLINQNLPQATIGVLIQDAQSGVIIYQHNRDKLLSPGSNMKLFTAAAALYHLGPNFRYHTILAQKNNDFYITFNGSPSLTTDNLKGLILTLKKLGIKKITGNIILDTLLFKPPYYAAGITYDDIGWYYDAPSTTLILNENTASFDFQSAKKLGMPIHITPKINNPGLKLINKVITVDKTQAKNHCNLNIENKGNNTLHLYGCLIQEEKPQTMQLAIPDPDLLATEIIKQTLLTNQIQLNGKILIGKTPEKVKPLVDYQSPEAIQLLTHMLVESDNLYADSFTKLLGYSLTGEGTYKQGAFAIKKILSKRTHLDMSQLELADGQGSRYNLVSPNQLVTLLTDLYHDEKIKPTFLSMLPRMGVSGTLKDRMKKSPLNNKVIAKTGTMHDISALSGFLALPNERVLIFSIVSNNIIGDIRRAKDLEEKILLTVYTKTAKI